MLGPAADSASAANDPNGKQQARQLRRDDGCEDARLGGGERTAPEGAKGPAGSLAQ